MPLILCVCERSRLAFSLCASVSTVGLPTVCGCIRCRSSSVPVALLPVGVVGFDCHSFFLSLYLADWSFPRALSAWAPAAGLPTACGCVWCCSPSPSVALVSVRVVGFDCHSLYLSVHLAGWPSLCAHRHQLLAFRQLVGVFDVARLICRLRPRWSGWSSLIATRLFVACARRRLVFFLCLCASSLAVDFATA